MKHFEHGNLEGTVVKIGNMIKKYELIFTEKCGVCGFLLSFRGGAPMLPLVSRRN